MNWRPVLTVDAKHSIMGGSRITELQQQFMKEAQILPPELLKAFLPVMCVLFLLRIYSLP